MRFRRPRLVLDEATGSEQLAPAPYVVAAAHGTDTALLDMHAERYYTLDVVGSRIWALLGAGHSVGDIVLKLAEEFDAPVTTIESDLHALLARLEERRLIVRAGETTVR